MSIATMRVRLGCNCYVATILILLTLIAQTTGTILAGGFRLQRVVYEARNETIQVYYSGTTKPTVYLYRKPGVPEALSHELGLVEMPADRSTPFLEFKFPDVSYTLSFNILDRFLSREEALPGFSIATHPGNDVAYQAGSDANFEVTVRYGSPGDKKMVTEGNEDVKYTTFVPNSSPTPEFDMFMSGKLAFVNEYQHYGYPYSPDNPLMPVGKFGNETENVHQFRWNSTDQDREGVVRFDLTLTQTWVALRLVLTVRATFYVRFHRADHQGPFPDGFVGFLKPTNVRMSNGQLTCYSGFRYSPCVLSCEAAGDHVTEAKIERVEPAEELRPNWRVRYFSSVDEFQARADVIFDPTNPEDSALYRCTARTDSREISKNITVTVW